MRRVIAEPARPPFPILKKFAAASSRPVSWERWLSYRTAKYAGGGPAVRRSLGYDVFRWPPVQVHVSGASSDATCPPNARQSFQTYCTRPKVRGSIQIPPFRSVLEGGAGFTQISNNVLDPFGITERNNHFSFSVLGGAGLDYHTPTPLLVRPRRRLHLMQGFSTPRPHRTATYAITAQARLATDGASEARARS